MGGEAKETPRRAKTPPGRTPAGKKHPARVRYHTGQDKFIEPSDRGTDGRFVKRNPSGKPGMSDWRKHQDSYGQFLKEKYGKENVAKGIQIYPNGYESKSKKRAWVDVDWVTRNTDTGEIEYHETKTTEDAVNRRDQPKKYEALQKNGGQLRSKKGLPPWLKDRPGGSMPAGRVHNKIASKHDIRDAKRRLRTGGRIDVPAPQGSAGRRGPKPPRGGGAGNGGTSGGGKSGSTKGAKISSSRGGRLRFAASVKNVASLGARIYLSNSFMGAAAALDAVSLLFSTYAMATKTLAGDNPILQPYIDAADSVASAIKIDNRNYNRISSDIGMMLRERKKAIKSGVDAVGKSEISVDEFYKVRDELDYELNIKLNPLWDAWADSYILFTQVWRLREAANARLAYANKLSSEKAAYIAAWYASGVSTGGMPLVFGPGGFLKIFNSYDGSIKSLDRTRKQIKEDFKQIRKATGSSNSWPEGQEFYLRIWHRYRTQLRQGHPMRSKKDPTLKELKKMIKLSAKWK